MLVTSVASAATRPNTGHRGSVQGSSERVTWCSLRASRRGPSPVLYRMASTWTGSPRSRPGRVAGFALTPQSDSGVLGASMEAEGLSQAGRTAVLAFPDGAAE
jgi:hypothetical protein